ncbi:MAG: hypothetical protein KJ995_06980 [Candidatus Omnitrophica bacterium]|nr:hypothetical protein [Candidatus Omnitrophota bacterium]MBU1128827.1 hypothetical protein [Candidatus Omnitrophota bacterium]MBU1657336.1 hypothetical protein [Candidatus Omnitrophota bacterium]MBU1783780.1 hypothetical protein [Candidatus Omnitrophota bacterium]MBU1852127.1 hypothetical protein [Candidatus Omnitrophota bacterium]
MDKFGFLLHNTDWHMTAKAYDEPRLDFSIEENSDRQRMTERVLRWVYPYYQSTITGIKSKTGKEIEGYFFVSMMVPEQFLNMNDSVLLRHLVKVGELAQSMGVGMLGLGAYTALVGRRGLELAKRMDIPITTGSAYTIVSIIEAIFLAASQVRLDLKKSNCVIVGATGKIGKVCSKMLVMSGQVGKVTLVARNESRLDAQKDDLLSIGNSCEVKVSTNLREALKHADVALFVTNYPKSLVSEDDFPPGAIVCDVSVPKNVSEDIFEGRNDILLFEGGVIRPPSNVDFNFFFGPNKGLAYACIAETMILTLERKFENYSIGANVDFDKVIEMKELAEKHGFCINELRSAYEVITDQRISRTAKSISDKNKKLVYL